MIESRMAVPGKEIAYEKAGGKALNSGIYYIIFHSNLGGFGDGLIVADEGRIHGGDSHFLYRGRYKVDGDLVNAEVRVSHYKGTFNSIFGTFGALTNFVLTLSGKATEDSFTFRGHISGQSQMKISVEGQKQADLFS